MIADNTIKQVNYPAGDPRHQPVLRQLVGSWVASGCAFGRWKREHPQYAERLSREAARWALLFAAGPKGKPLPVLSNHPLPDEGRRRINVGEFIGYQAFAAFLLCAAPRYDVGRCDRCGAFFWNRWGHANKRWCSRKCTIIGSASERQARRISKQRREKNARIKRAIAALIMEKPATVDWKEWVTSRARVTRSYLTRALHRGEQGKPDGLRLTKRQVEHLRRLSKGR